MKKKKMILTIGRGMVARNLLQNDFFKIIKARFQVILLTPAATDSGFINAFVGDDVVVRELKEIPHSWGDRICVSLHRYLLFDTFMGLKARYGIRGVSRPEEASFLRYLIYSVVFTPLSLLVWPKRLMRWLDFHLTHRALVRSLGASLKQEKIDLVMASSILSNFETVLVKAAKKFGIKTVGMVKSWDNPSKMGIRVVPDILVVWSDFMAEQFIKRQHVLPDKLKIVGVPQFDPYINKSLIWTRDRFCREMGLDSRKKIVLYTSAGKGVPEDADIVSYLIDFISRGEILDNPQLLIRPHFKYRADREKFLRLPRPAFVVIDDGGTSQSVGSFRDMTNFDQESVARLINTLYHSDVVVNVASTITLDAGAFNKPMVHPMLREPLRGKPWGDSYLMFYQSDYIRALQQTGAIEIAYSKNDLRNAVNMSLKDPEKRARERQAMMSKFCYRLDGLAGQRLAQVLLDCVS